jgi:hypothetical protein
VGLSRRLVRDLCHSHHNGRVLQAEEVVVNL